MSSNSARAIISNLIALYKRGIIKRFCIFVFHVDTICPFNLLSFTSRIRPFDHTLILKIYVKIMNLLLPIIFSSFLYLHLNALDLSKIDSGDFIGGNPYSSALETLVEVAGVETEFCKQLICSHLHHVYISFSRSSI